MSTTGIGVTVGNTKVVAFRPTVFVLNESLNAGTNSITCGSISLSSLSNNSALYVNGTGLFASSVLNNGQILIGSTGHVPVAANITGTTNQVNITNGANSITLSLPQNINTTATPQFGNLGINVAASGTKALNIQLAGTASTGLEIVQVK